MQKLNKQHGEILEILKNSKGGMNSYAWRTKYVQLPVRIKELKDMGHLIVSRRNRNRSVNYVFMGVLSIQPISHIPEVEKKAEIKPWEKPTIKVWSEKFKRYFWEEVKEPRQEVLF